MNRMKPIRIALMGSFLVGLIAGVQEASAQGRGRGHWGGPGQQRSADRQRSRGQERQQPQQMGVSGRGRNIGNIEGRMRGYDRPQRSVQPRPARQPNWGRNESFNQARGMQQWGNRSRRSYDRPAIPERRMPSPAATGRQPRFRRGIDPRPRTDAVQIRRDRVRTYDVYPRSVSPARRPDEWRRANSRSYRDEYRTAWRERQQIGRGSVLIRDPWRRAEPGRRSRRYHRERYSSYYYDNYIGYIPYRYYRPAPLYREYSSYGYYPYYSRRRPPVTVNYYSYTDPIDTSYYGYGYYADRPAYASPYYAFPDEYAGVGNGLAAEALAGLPIGDMLYQMTGSSVVAQIADGILSQAYTNGYSAGMYARDNGYSDIAYAEPYAQGYDICDTYSANMAENRRIFDEGYRLGYQDAMTEVPAYEPFVDRGPDLVGLLVASTL